MEEEKIEKEDKTSEKENNNLEGITEKEKREESRPFAHHGVRDGIVFAKVAGVAQTDISKRHQSEEFHRCLFVLDEVDEEGIHQEVGEGLGRQNNIRSDGLEDDLKKGYPRPHKREP